MRAYPAADCGVCLLVRGFFPIFQLIFLLTAFLFGGLCFWLLALPWHSAVILGIACGTVFGVGIGYFVRNWQVAVASDGAGALEQRLQLALIEMGYRLDDRFSRVLTFRPTLRSGILSDRFTVELHGDHLRITGPQYHLERLAEKLGVRPEPIAQ